MLVMSRLLNTFSIILINVRQSIFKKMPKNTSASYVSLKHYGAKKKKGECEDVIMKQYRGNLFNIKNKKPVCDYVTFAMRGHLSSHLKKKTRCI